MLFSATNVEKNIQLKVEHQCPQCGAPVTLGEETLFFVCSFCRVRSCIAQRDFFRYLFSLSPLAPQDCDLIYLPYWRFKGVQYACHMTGVEPRFLDLSALALDGVGSQIPFSLGFRSQALPLKLICANTPGKFLRPRSFKKTLPVSVQGSITIRKDQEPVFRETIGETCSLIYSPFYLHENRMFDGILNQPLPAGLPGDFDMADLDLCRPEQETIFIPGLCPDCGWDLEGHSNSLVMVCRNCQTLWQARTNRLAKIRYGCARPDHGEDLHIPFWKIQARITPLALASYGDLARMGNLTLTRQPQDQALYFWAPAFKVQPKYFLRVSTRLTLAQPDPALEKKIWQNPLLPVTLPASEAVQSIRITLGSLVRPSNELLPVVAESKVAPESITLVFLPFESRHHEVFHTGLNLAIPKNILTLSGNL